MVMSEVSGFALLARSSSIPANIEVPVRFLSDINEHKRHNLRGVVISKENWPHIPLNRTVIG